MLLPPELKLNVVEHLDPFSSFSFSITSKEHWKLCRLVSHKHRRLFAEAPVVGAATDFGNLLRDVIQDPSRGWYITELSLTASWNRRPPSTPMHSVDLLQDAARASMHLYSHLGTSEEIAFVDRIEAGVAAGLADSIVAVLIHHLPNLKTLKITATRGNNVLEDLLFRIAAEYAKSAIASRLPFQRLRTVSISHYDTESCASANWILPFLRIPSLRTFAGNTMGGEIFYGDETSKITFYPHPQSNIEELFFVNCQFDASTIEYMLSCTHALKRFTYSAGGCIIDDSPYDAKVVLKALSDYAQHSLESLLMMDREHTDEELSFRGPIEVDLTMFTKLHSLAANWTMLWPELSNTPARNGNLCCSDVELSCTPLDIRDKLPSSIRDLDLGGVFYDEEWEGVTTPLSEPNEQTPDLTVEHTRVHGLLKFHGEYQRREEVLAEVVGWDDRDKKKVFGGSDGAWIKDAWAPFVLFAGHGW